MHLLVEVELYKVPECHLFIYFSCRFGHILALFLWQRVVIGPILECGCAIEVAIVAECSIGYQPVLVLLKELLVCSSLHDLCTFLGINGTKIVHLGIVHAFVINLWQCI